MHGANYSIVRSAWFEILSNLSVVTLTIPTCGYKPKCLEIDRDNIRIVFDLHETAVLCIPGAKNPRSVRITGYKDGLDLRLKLFEKTGLEPTLTNVRHERNSVDESFLKDAVRISCRFCGNVIYDRGLNSRFDRSSSLPSEFWSDLCEYWSCHNEDFSKLPGQRHGDVIAQKDMIMYSRSYLLVHSSNLNIEALSLEMDQSTANKCRLTCSTCGHALGNSSYLEYCPRKEETDKGNEEALPSFGAMLYRVWVSIVVRSNDNSGSCYDASASIQRDTNLKTINTSFPSIFVFDVLDMCEVNAQYKFVCRSACGNNSLFVFIWVIGLNVICGKADIRIVKNSEYPNNVIKPPAYRCMKVLFSHSKLRNEALSELSGIKKKWLDNPEIEKVHYEFPLLEELLFALKLSNKALPPHKSRVKHWNIGLLRYS